MKWLEAYKEVLDKIFDVIEKITFGEYYDDKK